MALLFDNAANEWLTSGSTPVAGVPLTIAAWIYCDEDGTNWQTVVSVALSSSATDYVDLVAMSGVANDPMRFYTRAGATNVSASVNGLTFNAWNLVVGVTAGVASRFAYLNDVRGSEETTSASPAAFDRVRIGAIARSGTVTGNDFSGRIGEVGLWNAALTPAEIVGDLFLNRKPPSQVRRGSLKFYLDMRDHDYRDSIGGLRMTATGTPSIAPHPRIVYPGPRAALHVSAVAGTVARHVIQAYRRTG